jgi:hypothetical protein
VRRVPVRLREKAKLEVCIRILVLFCVGQSFLTLQNTLKIDPVKRRKFLRLLKRKRRLARRSGRTQKFAKRQGEFIFHISVCFSQSNVIFPVQRIKPGWRLTCGTQNGCIWWTFGVIDSSVPFQFMLPSLMILQHKALRPTEKSYRPSHRAAVYGSSINDVSYMVALELVGKLSALTFLLKQCCDLAGVGPWAAR